MTNEITCNQCISDTELVSRTEIYCRNSVYSTENYFVGDIESVLDLIQQEKTKNFVIKVRKHTKGDGKYEILKNNIPHVMWNIFPGTTNQIIDRKGYTGYIFFDIDQKDFSHEISVEELKELVFDSFDFVKAVWISVGGIGIGGIAYCPDLLQYYEENAFKQAFFQLNEHIKSHLNIVSTVDTKNNDVSRRNCLTSDHKILRREFPTHFKFNYNPGEEEPVARERKSKKTVIYDFLFDSDFYNNQLSEFDGYYYRNYIFCDEYQNPIPFAKKIFFKDIFSLASRFPKSIIKNQETFDEKSELVAYNDAGYSSVKISILPSTNFRFGKRKKSIESIIYKYLTIHYITNGEILPKSQVYTLACKLNERCRTKDGKHKLPFTNDELHNSVNYVFSTFDPDKFQFRCDKRKSLIGVGFENWYYQNSESIEKEYITSGTDERGPISKEKNTKEWVSKGLRPICARLSHQKRSSEKTEFINQCLMSGTISKEEIINQLKTKFKIGKSAAYKFMNRWNKEKGAKNFTNGVLLKKEEQKTCIREKKCTFSEPLGKIERTVNLIREKYNELIATGQKPTQQNVAKHTGFSLRTVKKYWKSISFQQNSPLSEVSSAEKGTKTN